MGYYYNLTSKPWDPDVISPKPSAPAYAASSFLLEGHLSKGPVSKLGINSSGYIFQKKNGSDIVIVLWDCFNPHEIKLKVGPEKSVELFDWMGNKSTRRVLNGSVNITIGNEPVYVKGVSNYTW
jgi:hypothetical protein